MTRSSTILLLTLLWLFPLTGSQAQETYRLLVLGDSLSAAYGLPAEKGWVSLLQKRLEDKWPGWQVINASITGDTTGGGLARLPAALERHRPAVVVIELGGNDGLRGLSLKVMRENLVRMIETSRAHGASVLLLGVQLPLNYAAYGEQFRAVYHEVANATGVPLVGFFLEGVAETRDLMQADGIHPAAEAQPRMLENVWPLLAPLLERSAP